MNADFRKILAEPFNSPFGRSVSAPTGKGSRMTSWHLGDKDKLL